MSKKLFWMLVFFHLQIIDRNMVTLEYCFQLVYIVLTQKTFTVGMHMPHELEIIYDIIQAAIENVQLMC